MAASAWLVSSYERPSITTCNGTSPRPYLPTSSEGRYAVESVTTATSPISADMTGRVLARHRSGTAAADSADDPIDRTSHDSSQESACAIGCSQVPCDAWNRAAWLPNSDAAPSSTAYWRCCAIRSGTASSWFMS